MFWVALTACGASNTSADEERLPLPPSPGLVEPPAEVAAPADAAAAPRAVVPEAGVEDIAIVDRPIAFDEQRKALTIEYRRKHQDPSSASIDISPRLIVLHYTGGSSADATWNYFNRTRIEQGRARTAAAGEVNVSSHFLVDRDGTIYRLVPETWMARHCIGLNHLAIGVENVGDGSTHPLTEAQVRANAQLVRYLAGRFSIEALIGHHEYRRLEGTDFFQERDPAYRNRKPDPGPAFMEAVRRQVADIGLAGPPGGGNERTP